MATGITAQEQHSPDAPTAQILGRDRYPLPTGRFEPHLTYDNRVPEHELFKFMPVCFAEPSPAGWRQTSIAPDSVVLCDNLAGLNALSHSKSRARLIYMDPPYNTGLGFHSRSLQHAYKDDRSTALYVEFMRRRLILARECMADDGSIYVHIGHQMLGHLKVLMDEIFGVRNFRNIISRRKCSSKNFTAKQYPNLQDYLLFYTKSSSWIWNQPGRRPSEEWIDREYTKVDARGRYKLVPVHAPGTRRGETGLPWRGMNPPPGKHWQYAPAKLEELDREGYIHWSKTGNPRRKIYLGEDKSVPFTDNWDCFRDAHHQSIGITGYPTEKNLDMLRMIVGASSNPGDLVVDPFCGSGTTLQAARDLGRHWIGIDESFVAVEATIKRLRYGLEPMGDYVSRGSGTKSPRAAVDLFEARNHRSQNDSEVRFLVDDELLGEFGEEIDRLVDP